MTALMPESDRSTGDARWQRVWEHRAAMLRIARRRCRSWHDAEDVVGQAMLAALSCGVPDDELAPWLSRVVMNLCAESHRAHERSRRLAVRAAGHAELVDPGHEDHVITRMAAEDISAEWARLPERQRRVLAMRSHGFTVTDIALELELPYKTVESLLSRARSGLRAVAQTLAGGVGVVWGARRYGPRAALIGAGPAVAAAFVLAAPTFGGSANADQMTTPLATQAGMSTAMHAAEGGSLAIRSVVHAADRMSSAPPAAYKAPTQPLTPRLQPTTGKVSAGVGGVGREHPDEDLVQSLRRCLSDGVEVTTENVGCKPR
jgi:RNA polymerase sigma factor (sigma-70 family)